MRPVIFHRTTTALLVSMILAACAPQAASPTPDVIGTTAAQLAAVMMTQTAGAVMPTPPPPAETATPAITDTPAVPTDKPALKPPSVITFAGCWAGPGESYPLISNIDPSIRKGGRQVVTILGIGSEPGWYIIQNPYFNNPCWIRAENMEIDPLMDLSQFPVMTPSPP